MSGKLQVALALIGLATAIVVAVKEVTLALIAADKEITLTASRQGD